ncbi:MAG: sialidase family protein [Anaerolineales bacterium]|nr:sialidase family protein [Anaerolineales bacterium]
MFRLAVPVRWRAVMAVTAFGLACLALGVGGAVWYALRCNVLDYIERAAASPSNPRQQYLFACGYLYESVDGGQTWLRRESTGLPFGAREGWVAVDRQPGVLYLGTTIFTNSSAYCWNCAWTYLRPAIFVSTDGGKTWQFAYRFRRGPANQSSFLGLYADPDKAGFVWAIVKNRDEISHYATATHGYNWKRMCYEYYFVGSGCAVPESIRRLTRLETGAEGGGVK